MSKIKIFFFSFSDPISEKSREMEELKQEVERLKIIVGEQREMIQQDVAQSILPTIREIVLEETKRELASKTLQISMNPGFLKDYYNKLAVEDRKEYLDAVDYAHKEALEILEIAPKFKEKIFRLKGLFEILQSSSVKNSCSATELDAHHFNELSDSINMLPKMIIPDEKKETQQQSSNSNALRRPYEPNYRRTDRSPYEKYAKYK